MGEERSKSPSHISSLLRRRWSSALRVAMLCRASARSISSFALDRPDSGCKTRAMPLLFYFSLLLISTIQHTPTPCPIQSREAVVGGVAKTHDAASNVHLIANLCVMTIVPFTSRLIVLDASYRSGVN
ncbi:hypothetical protein E2C01_010247 [Portunus trituberculatus]|uniref:Uncharacterized protein n=1 Tax=Portunus trituberculatus TaxID=210409 RepID=A0A5B7D802_PORTR|nr:hypothetical protein [Portunus trituberculatus]